MMSVPEARCRSWATGMSGLGRPWHDTSDESAVAHELWLRSDSAAQWCTASSWVEGRLSEWTALHAESNTPQSNLDNTATSELRSRQNACLSRAKGDLTSEVPL